MKLLLLTTNNTNYIRDCWTHPVTEVYDTVYVPCILLRKYMSAERLAEYILNVLDNDDFEYVFVYSDGLTNNSILPEGFFVSIKEKYKVVTFHADDEPEKWYAMNATKDHRYHVIFSHSMRASKRRDNGFYLPWGFNPDVHNKISGIKKDIDVLFIGINKCKVMLERFSGGYYEDGDLRQQVLTKVYRFCKEKGYNFKLYGSGWKYHPILKECDGGYLSDEETVSTINRAKIVINIAFSSDQDAAGYQTKTRHFEIGGCGSFQITNYNPELEELYGDSLGFVDDLDNIGQVIDYYLTHEQEREEKAAEAYRISHSRHTMPMRIKYMFEKAAEYLDKPLSLDEAAGIRVKSIAYSSREQLMDILKNIENNTLGLGDNDYLHFYDTRLQKDDLNISRLNISSGEDIYLADSIVSIFTPDSKGTFRTHHRSFPEEAIYLPAFYDPSLPDGEKLLEEFDSFELDGKTAFLINSIIKKDLAAEVLRAVLFGNTIISVNFMTCDYCMGDYLFYTEKRFFDPHTEAIRRILDKRNKGYKVAFYGGRESLAHMVVREIKDSGSTDNVWIIDRDIDGLDELHGPLSFISTDDVLSGKMIPDILAITSQRREVEMWETVQPLSDRVLLLPLYDLEHVNWEN